VSERNFLTRHPRISRFWHLRSVAKQVAKTWAGGLPLYICTAEEKGNGQMVKAIHINRHGGKWASLTACGLNFLKSQWKHG